LPDSKIVGEFRKAHPDMEVGANSERFDKFMEKFAKIRTLQNVHLYVGQCIDRPSGEPVLRRFITLLFQYIPRQTVQAGFATFLNIRR